MGTLRHENGVVHVVKPPHMTSHDVVGFIRRSNGLKKVGHTGTLDPMAAGLMTLCIGKATRISEYLLSEDKGYRAELTFGLETDTQDIWGTVLSRSEARPSEEAVLEVLDRFLGTGRQEPPMYSAVRHKGKKLYELARQGVSVKRKTRPIEIKELKLIDFHGDRAMVDILCTKGTYVRTLCHDIGKALGCGAAMSFLLRTTSGPFSLRDAAAYNDPDLLSRLIPTEEALYMFERLHLEAEAFERLSNGNTVPAPVGCNPGNRYVLFAGKRFVGIGHVFSEEGTGALPQVKIDKLLV